MCLDVSAVLASVEEDLFAQEQVAQVPHAVDGLRRGERQEGSTCSIRAKPAGACAI